MSGGGGLGLPGFALAARALRPERLQLEVGLRRQLLGRAADGRRVGGGADAARRLEEELHGEGCHLPRLFDRVVLDLRVHQPELRPEMDVRAHEQPHQLRPAVVDVDVEQRIVGDAAAARGAVGGAAARAVVDGRRLPPLLHAERLAVRHVERRDLALEHEARALVPLEAVAQLDARRLGASASAGT